MKIGEAVLKKLDLSDAAKAVTLGQFDRFPRLLLDRCLETSSSSLVKSVVADFQAGTAIPFETITMPRRGFGPRPITVTSPSTRVAYRALVQKIASALPEPRSRSSWEAYDAFGKENASESSDPWDNPPYYLVELDIASCYEYIDHGILRDELIRRTLDVQHSEVIVGMLNELFTNRRGLPQLGADSDVLADTYLEIIERQLLRTYTDTLRFADDFRVVSPDWGHANGVIEDAAECARTLGLILSTEKTNITKSETIAKRKRENEEFMAHYFSEAKEALSGLDFTELGYGFQFVKITPGEEETVREAFRRVVEDWYDKKGQDVPQHTQQLALALNVLASSEVRLPDDWLTEIVFKQPLKLQNVARYVMARSESEDNWTTLTRLTAMQRQSPWAKIWLLHVLNSFGSEEGGIRDDVMQWTAQQLKDRHEVVRSEAAWTLACNNRVTEGALADLYREASSITRPAIAASCAVARISESSGLVKAIKADHSLASGAYDWGKELVDR